MMRYCLGLGLGVLGVIGLLVEGAIGQVVSDGTVDTEVSLEVGLLGITYQIQRGTTVGGRNLFHSFSRFDIPNGRTANFQTPVGIVNIFARVTGSQASNIEGVINAGGSANLFLLNPNGIIFGQNARLNIGGSFVATTADAIEFPNNAVFSRNSSVSSNNSLLSINPSALLFNPATFRGSIVSRAGQPIAGAMTGLRVNPGRGLFLIGGDVRLEGGVWQAPGGRIELGGLANQGRVELIPEGNSWRLGFPEGVVRSNVVVTSGAILNVAAAGRGGAVTITSRNLDINGGTTLRAGVSGSSNGVSNVKSGNVTFDSSEKIDIRNALISNSVSLPSTSASTPVRGNSGDITVKGGSLTLENAVLTSSTFSEGDAGNISIQLTGDINLIGVDQITLVNNTGQGNSTTTTTPVITSFASTGTTNTNTSQNLNLSSNSLISNGAFTQRLTNSSGGNILENIRIGNAEVASVDSGLIIGESLRILSQTVGLEDILDLTSNPESPNSETRNLPNSITSIPTNSPPSLLIPVTGIFSTVERAGKGNAGNVNIVAQSVNLTKGAEIQSLTRGEGQAGNIDVQAQSVILSGVASSSQIGNTRIGGFSSGLISESAQGATGKAGDILVNTGTLSLFNGAVLSSRTKSNFDGGNITVNTNTLEIASGAQILTTTFGAGNAGNINAEVITSANIAGSDPTFAARSQEFSTSIDTSRASSGIFADTSPASTGNGGNINFVSVPGTLNISDQARIASNADGRGSAGLINIRTGRAELRRNGDILTSSVRGDGGAINITAGTVLALEDSDILATAQNGQGGNISFNTNGFFAPINPNNSGQVNINSLDDNEQVDVNASGLTPGKVTFSTNDTIQNNLTQLPNSQIDIDQILAQSCLVRRTKPQGTFYILGNGSLPPRPDDPAMSDYPTNTIQPIQIAEKPWKIGDPIVEPEGFFKLADGRLVLGRECRDD
jgi:filamentous hemagglutinin family protein